MEQLKKKVYNLLNPGVDESKWERLFDGFIIGLILINLISVIAETFPGTKNWSGMFHGIEVFSVLVFTAEYLLRVWTAPCGYPGKKPEAARLRYIFSLMALIDLVAILPFYLPFVGMDLRILRGVRLIRLFRLLKFNRYTNALELIGHILKTKANQLISSIFVIGLMMVISSVLMYNLENPVQPEVFENAFSGMWWAIATVTTVGYGDIYPITAGGKILSAFIAFLGIGLVAVPTGILSAGFMELTEGKTSRKEKHYCPYCGEKLDG